MTDKTHILYDFKLGGWLSRAGGTLTSDWRKARQLSHTDALKIARARLDHNNNPTAAPVALHDMEVQ